MPNRRMTVTFAVFGYDVHVILSRNIEATGRRLREDLSNAEGAFVTKDDQPLKGWLVLEEKPNEGVIAHEAAHAIRAMLTNAGVSLDDESFAYHLQFLVERIHRFVKRAT